jgi:GntR family transcriptional regulator of arabinose operon
MQTDLPRKSDSAYFQLLERIQSGYWKIGEAIPGELKLAEQFNCSRGTIGKALTRLSHEGLVKRKTKTGTQIIRSSIERVAKSIDLDAVAFIYPSEKHEGIWRTVTGFRNAAVEIGQRTMTLTTGTDYKKEVELIVSLNELNVKGAVFYLSVQTPEDQVHISQALVRSTFPIVLACINLPGMNLPAVFFDDFHAGYTMTKHVISRGARRIGFFSSSRAPDGCHGYQWALQETGIQALPELVLLEQRMHADYEDPLREPSRRAEEYLRTHPGIEAVVCGYDYLAIGIIEAAQKLGIKVPQDLLVTGIDDFSCKSPVPLTTYRVPYEEIGQRTFSLLMERIRTGKTSVLENHVTGHLVVRESA